MKIQAKNCAELSPLTAAIICIDMQEKLLNVMIEKEKIIQKANQFIQAAHLLNIPFIFCEQYPKGLGPTSSKLHIQPQAIKIEKTTFSAFGNQAFCHTLESKQIKELIIFGIESHICVRQTALDAKDQGLRVIIAEDSCSTRNPNCHHIAMQELREEKIKISTTEAILFSFLLDCQEEHFKPISALIK